MEDEEIQGCRGGILQGQKRSKRQMKTPFQLETLENVYAMDAYPSEGVRAELSVKLGLTDRQLQMWFCHRRLKEKKETLIRKPISPVLRKAPLYPSLLDSDRVPEPSSEPVSDSGSGSSSFGRKGHWMGLSRRSGVPRMKVEDGEPASSYLEEQSHPLKLKAIAAVEAQLGEPLRQDAPILGVEFDPLPPDAFGAPIDMVPNGHVGRLFECDPYDTHRGFEASSVHSNGYQSIRQSSARHDVVGIGSSRFYDWDGDSASYSSFDQGCNYIPGKPYHDDILWSRNHMIGQDDGGVSLPIHGYASIHHKTVSTSTRSFPDCALQGSKSKLLSCTIEPSHDDNISQLKRKRKFEEPKMGKQAKLYKKHTREDLGKQDSLKPKRERQMRKELEQRERERRKEERKLLREKQRDEEKAQREQRREFKRREKMLQKEFLKAEKRQKREEIRRQKEDAKQKAAMEKATARRYVRENLGLIDDEKLELMELPVSGKRAQHCVNSQVTQQDLDSSNDLLSAFPPVSVKLKKPFAIDPWINSDKNIANLVMVWNFLISFADVLGLWPFTLDEFLQALHDHDSRLLSEVHIALLKVIIDDIEDAVCVRSNAVGTNLTLNSEERHLSIVEGAYAWGFDISTWKRHLNVLTWPEILRQLALSSGLGPHLKENNITKKCIRDGAEGIYNNDIISTLRDGSAAENAFAVMRGKRLTVSRRSGHRLTPGTVKFAAFHILSVEGSKGITIPELAAKIQKSGLRDLTTSKAPEASIAAALSRDVNLFQRTAPSTYCLRSPFRKGPAEAESVLAAAIEKLRIFQNHLGVAVVADVLERDGDDDGCILEGFDSNGVNVNATNADICSGSSTCSYTGKEGCGSDCSCNSKNTSKTGKGLCCFEDGDGTASVLSSPKLEPLEIDESKSFESWVEGLTEGEYSGLSVGECLEILVVLVGMMNECNSIRAILEDRLRAAAALKKQILVNADMDRKRLMEHSRTVEEEMKSPDVLHKNSKAFPNTLVGQEVATSLEDQGLHHCPSNYSYREDKFASQRCVAQQKCVIAHRAEGVYKYRSMPLGEDRRRNRYWRFAASPSPDDRGNGRIFVESYDGCWWLIDSVEAFDGLLACLDTRGVREYYLHSMLQEIERSFKECVSRSANHSSNACKDGTIIDEIFEPSTSFNIKLGRSSTEKEGAADRYHHFQRWIWKQYFSSLPPYAKKYAEKSDTLLLVVCHTCLEIYGLDDQSCPTCNATLESSPRELHSLQIRVLKAILAEIEASIPRKGFHLHWGDERRSWGQKLLASASIGQFMQALILLENAIARNYLFEFSAFPSLPPWIPQTTAAAALLLLQLDASISYDPHQEYDFTSCDKQGRGYNCSNFYYSRGKTKSCDQKVAEPVGTTRLEVEAVQDPVDVSFREEDSDEGDEGCSERWVVRGRDVGVCSSGEEMDCEGEGVSGDGRLEIVPAMEYEEDSSDMDGEPDCEDDDDVTYSSDLNESD